jgi:hypothetical protein
VHALNHWLGWLINMVMAIGLIWAVVVWRSRHRAAVLVAVACALQLAVRLFWSPGMRWLIRNLAPSSDSVQRFFGSLTNDVYLLALAVSFGFLIYAALNPGTRKS